MANQDDPSLSLTPQQVRLLRLVRNGLTSSKALSRETGLQPGSIDTYLQSAARMLNAKGRIEAAASFAALDSRCSQPPSQLRSKGFVRRTFSVVIRLASTVWKFMIGLPIGGQEQAFSWKRIVLETVRVALIAMALLTALVLVVRGWMRTFG